LRGGTTRQSLSVCVILIVEITLALGDCRGRASSQ